MRIRPRINVTSFHVVSNHIESLVDTYRQKIPRTAVMTPKILSSLAAMILSDINTITGLIKISMARKIKKKK
jgi:hypothetical protein